MEFDVVVVVQSGSRSLLETCRRRLLTNIGTELYCNMIIAAFSHLLRKLNDCILQLELERKRLQSRVSG